jgi:hypothetical protein
VNRNRRRPPGRRLEEADAAELRVWVARCGLERVARLVAALTVADGERGQPDKLDTLLLLKMAHLKRARPRRTLHAIAVEVAEEAYAHRNRIAPASLIIKLERDFRAWRQTWQTLAQTVRMPSPEQIADDLRRKKSEAERRAIARIVEIMPSAIDFFDMALLEAKQVGKEKYKLVRAFSRERAEPLLVEALEMIQKNSFAKWNGEIPRTLLDLIEPELAAFARKRRASP